jgi:predicted nucleic acid-binding protein
MSGAIVADAGPLHYLVLVQCAGLLSRLFDRVLVPIEVRDELSHPNAPEGVKNWIKSPPPWLVIKRVGHFRPVLGLHPGETAAFAAGASNQDNGASVDDMDGRAAARRLGLTVIGTIGVLERMSEIRLIELSATISSLRKTNFFASSELLEAVLERDRQRRKS